MRAIVVEPMKMPRVEEIGNTLQELQQAVGGSIEVVPAELGDDALVICNDEGKLMNLSPNRGLRDKDGQIYDIVCGTFFLCGAPPDNDHFTSLTPEQIERYQKRFYTPEMFWGMDGHIVCLPLEVD